MNYPPSVKPQCKGLTLQPCSGVGKAPNLLLTLKSSLLSSFTFSFQLALCCYIGCVKLSVVHTVTWQSQSLAPFELCVVCSLSFFYKCSINCGFYFFVLCSCKTRCFDVYLTISVALITTFMTAHYMKM